MVRIKRSDIEHGRKKAAKRSPLAVVLDSFRRRAEASYEKRVKLRRKLSMAGFSGKGPAANAIVLVLSVILTIALTFYCLDLFYEAIRGNILLIVLVIVLIWVVGFCIFSVVLWYLLYSFLDLLIFRRKRDLEEVLPDFLQLTSSNIRAGMTIDQALWLSVRPRFGVLANEIEEVAKRTVAGESLDSALSRFVQKYDSRVLERSMNILIEGIHAGGEIGDLLDKISANIQENNIMKKEMAASVTTYVIFISFATVIAAPFLFSMAYQLITVIQQVFSRVNLGTGTVTGFAITVSADVISVDDFQVFAVISLILTSVFSAMIVSVIRKGDVKDGIKYIPLFIVSSLVLFFVLSKLFGMMVKGFF